MTWMDSKYQDKAVECSVCGKEIPPGEPRKYDKESKKNAHAACAGGGEQVYRAPLETKTCEGCGKTMVVWHTIIEGAAWKEHFICGDCDWLRKASRGLKLARLWAPAPGITPTLIGNLKEARE